MNPKLARGLGRLMRLPLLRPRCEPRIPRLHFKPRTTP